MNDLRPPRFRHDEIVRIVGTTGRETNSRDEPFDASPWIGHEVRVEGAEPTADQREWLIGVWVELPESVEELAVVDQVFFAEDSLESTGLVQVGWDEGGEPRRRPFDPATEPGWRNQIGVSLVPEGDRDRLECTGSSSCTGGGGRGAGNRVRLLAAR